MSTSGVNTAHDGRAKLTRGEKCIFTHVVVTFVLLVVIVLIYLVHLYVVNHTWHGVSKTRRFHLKQLPSTENLPIGLAYLNVSPRVGVCNTILFRQKWSIAPGHCVAMRSENDMLYVFLSWRIKYKSSDVDTKIQRSIVHPKFNRNTMSNNIGLFEHTNKVKTLHLIGKMPTLPIYALYNQGDMVIESWDSKSTFEENTNSINNYPVQMMPPDVCSRYVSTIMALRSYEYCVTFAEKRDDVIEYGAVVKKDNVITGIFSWGEKMETTLPFVILNISYYYDWVLHEAS